MSTGLPVLKYCTEMELEVFCQYYSQGFQTPLVQGRQGGKRGREGKQKGGGKKYKEVFNEINIQLHYKNIFYSFS